MLPMYIFVHVSMLFPWFYSLNIYASIECIKLIHFVHAFMYVVFYSN